MGKKKQTIITLKYRLGDEISCYRNNDRTDPEIVSGKIFRIMAGINPDYVHYDIALKKGYGMWTIVGGKLLDLYNKEYNKNKTNKRILKLKYGIGDDVGDGKFIGCIKYWWYDFKDYYRDSVEYSYGILGETIKEVFNE